MASPGIPVSVAVTLYGKARFDYFEAFARYQSDAPEGKFKYMIRVGSKTLFSEDTRDLYDQFCRRIKSLKLQQTHSERRRRRVQAKNRLTLRSLR